MPTKVGVHDGRTYNGGMIPNKMMFYWQMHSTRILLGMILGLGAILRFLNLGSESLWNDELATWVFTIKDGLGEVIQAAGVDRSPPLYQVLVYLSTKLLGDLEWSLRLPSVLFSLAFLGLFYHWGQRFYDKSSALLATALAAFLYMPIYFAQEARNYSLLLLLSMACFYYCTEVLLLLRDKKRSFPWPLAYLGAVSLLTAYTHYFGLLLVVVQGVLMASFALALKNRSMATKILSVYSIVGLLYLPWFKFIYPAALDDLPFWIPRPTASSFVDILQFYFNDSLLFATVAVFLVVGYAFIAMVDSVKAKQKVLSSFTLFQLLSVALVLAFAFIKSHFSTSVFQSKYFIIFAPLAYLHTARAALGITRSKVIQRVIVVGIIYGVFLHLFFVIDYYDRTDKKEQFNEAFKIMARYVPTSDSWPMVSFVWNPKYLDYYLIRNKIMIRQGINLRGDENDFAEAQRFIEGLKSQTDHFWFFSGHRFVDSGLLQSLSQHYIPLKVSRLRGVQLVLFQIPPAKMPDHALGSTRHKGNSFRKIKTDKKLVEIN